MEPFLFIFAVVFLHVSRCKGCRRWKLPFFYFKYCWIYNCWGYREVEKQLAQSRSCFSLWLFIPVSIFFLSFFLSLFFIRYVWENIAKLQMIKIWCFPLFLILLISLVTSEDEICHMSKNNIIINLLLEYLSRHISNAEVCISE